MTLLIFSAVFFCTFIFALNKLEKVKCPKKEEEEEEVVVLGLPCGTQKLCQKIVSEAVCILVCSHLSLLLHVQFEMKSPKKVALVGQPGGYPEPLPHSAVKWMPILWPSVLSSNFDCNCVPKCAI